MILKNQTTDLLNLLEDLGHRSTSQRRAIVDHVVNMNEGFTAEELFDDLPTVGRATIYRTIKLLVISGVLCKLSMPSGSPRYVLARAAHHHHTVCIQCGTVGEFRDSTVERVLRTIGQEIPGHIVGHRMELFLVCRHCSVKESI